ncbi:autotransporter outer membrane beta-barrel domain-containing protein [Actinobacillus porcitonsillarum]|uniref:autotransporter outer membrane beta-barrel domain-containing protein n=1 Tax=Actinobacillus porcitonsillarum TaxID=189834 RepID=UPI00142D4749|nr:autotransporter outer membrane beta-barrel domain-containing protein [Actinobacillus porcitonsillarum]
MRKLKLSAVYTALIASGLAVSSAESFARNCDLDTNVINQTNAILDSCTTSFSYNGKEETYLVDLMDSTLNVSASNVGFTSTDESFPHDIFRANNSTLNIQNSDAHLNAKLGDIIQLTNSSSTLKNSSLGAKNGANNISLENSTITINDGWIWGSDDGVIVELSKTGNTVNFNNVSIPRSTTVFGQIIKSNDTAIKAKINLDNTKIQSKFLILAGSNDDAGLTNPLNEEYDLTATNYSRLSGTISIIPDSMSKDPTINLTLNNSEWTVSTFTDTEENIKYENAITNLALNNGTVNIQKETPFQTLTIGNLTGSGTFIVNTDIAEQNSDKIVITGSAEGSHSLRVKDTYKEPNTSDGKVILVKISGKGDATFGLLNGDYINAGAYRYYLGKDGNDWVLSHKVSQPEKPVEQPKPVAPVEEQPEPTTPPTSEQTTEVSPTPPVVPVIPTEQPEPTTPESVVPPMVEKALSEKSNALVSLRQAQLALVESNLEGLHQRLGELKNGEKGNVWVRNVNSRNDFASTRTASDSHSSGFEQDVHSVQLGADAALTDNIRLGGFVGNARSDVDFDGEYGSGKVKTQSLGLYGTYLASNGFYWDNVAKYEYVKSESASTGKRKYNAYTLSTEVGRIHQLGQGWTVTPQIQAAWTRLSSQSDEERLSALTARAGVRVAKAIEFDGWKLQPYAEVNGITTQTNQSTVRVNQYLFDVSESKGRIQTALGINAAVGNHRLALEGSVTNGKYLDQPYKVQAVYRYSW